jgi:hypothetical protein
VRLQEAARARPRPRSSPAPERAGVVSFTLEDRPAADASGKMAKQQKIRILTVTLASPDAAPASQFAAKK